MIVLISHNDSSLTVTCHPGWTIKLTRPGTQRAKFMVEGTAGLEYLEGKNVIYSLCTNSTVSHTDLVEQPHYYINILSQNQQMEVGFN